MPIAPVAKIRLWLDDCRPLPVGWDVSVPTVPEAIALPVPAERLIPAAAPTQAPSIPAALPPAATSRGISPSILVDTIVPESVGAA